MFLPSFFRQDTHQALSLHFGGLDLRSKPEPDSLSESENMSSLAFPALSPRKPREKVVSESGITDPVLPEYTGAPITAFTGIKNHRFYYQGKWIGPQIFTDDKKAIVDFNGKICIFPDKLYYNYLPDPETGEVSESLELMEKTVALNSLTFYGSSADANSYYSYIHSSEVQWADHFSIGESIIISGADSDHNNIYPIMDNHSNVPDYCPVSAVITDIRYGRMDLVLHNKNGKRLSFFSGTSNTRILIQLRVPDMDHVCVHNNRLWGTDPSGKYLYASKLGDCMNFNCFQGLASDSWFSQIGTAGKFTGIVSYRSSVVAFKHHCIHHIYGDAPNNFAIPKQTNGGCIDGKSIAELHGVLYYLSPSGFCAYAGGEPYNVSPQLPVSYVSASAGTDGVSYYAAACQNDGSRHLLVYHPEKGVWHREDDIPFLRILPFGNQLYGFCQDGIWALGQGEEQVSWSFTSQPMSYDTLRHKSVQDARLLLDAEAGTNIRVSISHDGGEFIPCGSLTAVKGMKSYRLPIRFQPSDSFRIRVEGQGNAVIHAIELSVYQGGKTYVL
ncbi:MAG: hypothetical protein IJB80_00460 [Clostridia bacterium]|nr:hypothetical protein [Clostridia bacterium]